MISDNTRCSICATLADEESAYQKYGWEEHDTYLPAAAGKLTIVKDFKPYSSRKLQIQQCRSVTPSTFTKLTMNFW